MPNDYDGHVGYLRFRKSKCCTQLFRITKYYFKYLTFKSDQNENFKKKFETDYYKI